MLALLFALQGMYRAFNPPVRKQPEVRHVLASPNETRDVDVRQHSR